MTRPLPAVDLHAHVAVPEADALLAGAEGLREEQAAERAGHSPASLTENRTQLEQVARQLTDVTRRLADLDRMGVSVQVVGPMPMHHYWAGPKLRRDWVEATNTGIAAHVALAPRRLLGLGTVALQQPDLAAAQLTRAVTELGLRGVSVSTTVAGRELADPRHDPFWAAAEELRAVVFIHPWGCSLGPRLASNYLGNIVGQPTETTVALSHLIFDGVLDRFPRLKLLAAHGGGYLPTYIGRSDHAWRVRPDARGCAQPPSEYLRRIWFDSLVFTPQALESLVEAAGSKRVVLGTDYPFDMGVSDPLDRLDATLLGDRTRERIRAGNAARLLSTVCAEGLP